MKQYLLFIFGDFTSSEVRGKITNHLCDVSCSELVKYKETATYMYFNFETDLKHYELVNYLNSNISIISDTHILSEFNDSTSITMPYSDLKEFITLKMNNKETDIFKNILNNLRMVDENNITESIINNILKGDNDIFSKDDDCYDDDDDDDDDGNYKVTKLKPNLDLDKILDKIKREGKSSLTDEEIKFLKTV